MLVAALGMASVRINSWDALRPSPTRVIELASWSGTQREPFCHKALLGTGTSTAAGLRNDARGPGRDTLCLIRLAIASQTGTGGEPINRPFLRASITSRDCCPIASPSRGVQERREANSNR